MRSHRISGRFCSATLALVLAATASPAGVKPEPPERAETTSTRMVYEIVRGGVRIGSETVTRRVFNDNTVVFDSRMQLTPAEGVEIDHETSLTVSEDSYFPRSYEQRRHMEQGDLAVDMELDVEMFANVAVARKTTRGVGSERVVVLPAGAAFIEIGLIHYYYQLLFSYNRELGGRQQFELFDVQLLKQDSAVMQLVGRETVTVDGREIEADVYRVQREQYEATLYVDGTDTIVRAEQNVMTFDLVEQSRGVGG